MQDVFVSSHKTRGFFFGIVITTRNLELFEEYIVKFEKTAQWGFLRVI